MYEYNTLPQSEISHEQLDELVGLIDEAQVSPYATANFENTKTFIGATCADSYENGRSGTLIIQNSPPSDPAAFLSVRHQENGFGDNRNETEVLYTFSRDIDGIVSMNASDLISIDVATELLVEAAAFDESVKDHPDTEMVGAAKNDIQCELNEAFTFEEYELSSTLKPATLEDYEKLRALLQFALNGDAHKDKYQNDVVDSQPHMSDSDEVTAKRHGRIAGFVGRVIQILK